MSDGVFDLNEIVRRFPATADTMLVDTRLTDEQVASCRVFRLYKPVPAHFHATCDEYLLVLSGRGRFVIGSGTPFDIAPGQLLHFKKATVHAVWSTSDEPLVFLAIDTPRRDPKDITFVNPADGTAETFIQTSNLY